MRLKISSRVKPARRSWLLKKLRSALCTLLSSSRRRCGHLIGQLLDLGLEAAHGRRRIVLATDSPIGFWEACHRPRLVDDSSFTVIQMHIDAEGRGTGTMSVATKIRAYDNSIEFEDLASCRVMLTDILAVPDDERE